MFYPTAPNPASDGMNWSVGNAGGAIVFAAIYYAVTGKRMYLSPMTGIREHEDK
jgi:choline transport protein